MAKPGPASSSASLASSSVGWWGLLGPAPPSAILPLQLSEIGAASLWRLLSAQEVLKVASLSLNVRIHVLSVQKSICGRGRFLKSRQSSLRLVRGRGGSRRREQPLQLGLSAVVGEQEKVLLFATLSCLGLHARGGRLDVVAAAAVVAACVQDSNAVKEQVELRLSLRAELPPLIS